jgi:hypothetical protein
VNYLSHFVIDNRPGDHYYNAALILPDITRRWIRTFKQPPPPTSFSANQLRLLDGCLRHYESDRLFHASSFFEQHQANINTLLKSKPFSPAVHRKWFIAHVLAELLTDRKIVRTFPEMADRFYLSLEAVDYRELKPFLEYYGMADTGEFLRFFDQFRSDRYIYSYADNKKFLYSLERIMMRAGIGELTANDEALLMEAVLETEGSYMNDGAILLNELKQVFNNT